MSTTAQRLANNAKKKLLENMKVSDLYNRIKSDVIEQITSGKCTWTHSFTYVQVPLNISLIEPVIYQTLCGEDTYAIDENYHTILHDEFIKEGFLIVGTYLSHKVLEKIELEVVRQ
jgi:hypothetical protein